uniref:Ribosome-releasing factor 2, mitochondrial-like n=2 Tax=Hirondellea gigas TaxID=1518452 RepID=A0A2P2I9W2_9CRUS
MRVLHHILYNQQLSNSVKVLNIWHFCSSNARCFFSCSNSRASSITSNGSSCITSGSSISRSSSSDVKSKKKAAAATAGGGANTRVIGIMAHIDAGKTTTTERMLFYSGFQATIGEVHHGDTTMDYLQQERDRGITIQSAAVTFPWRDHNISLVDTPGHVDFTVEVERCIRVVDGAIAVIDASAGVEAQTVTVWQQANRYSVPRICYFNKMDKPAACYLSSLQQLRTKLAAKPILLQLPIGSGKQFTGVLDVLSGRALVWDLGKTHDRGATYTISDKITPDSELYSVYSEARTELCDQLGDLDNAVAEYIMEHEALDSVPSSLLVPALKKATIKQECVPVLLGSSYRNIGVQPLMDAVLSYLPGPMERLPRNALLYSPSLCALAFKIVNDFHRGGLLTFVRIYTGTIDQNSRIYNVSRQCSEKPSKLYTVLADEYKEIETAGPGSIVVIAGLKKTSTGDTLVASQLHVHAALEKLQKIPRARRKDHDGAGVDARSGDHEDVGGDRTDDGKLELQQDEQDHLLLGVKVPDPVFFCSIEAVSPRHQKGLEEALNIMQREDPSLIVKHDVDTGQIVMGGMGELHLEIVASRLESQYKVAADLGTLQVAYREQILVGGERTLNVEKVIGDQKQQVHITLQLEPDPGHTFKKVELQLNKDNRENLLCVRQSQLKAVKAGVTSALSSGPVLNCPVTGVRVFLKWLSVGRRTRDSFLTATVGQCVKQLLSDCECCLSEPVMLLTVAVDMEYSQLLLADLGRRRAEIKEITVTNDVKHLTAHVPLAELIGYSSAVRRSCSGRATFSMELLEYRAMASHEQREAIKQVTGFYPT